MHTMHCHFPGSELFLRDFPNSETHASQGLIFQMKMWCLIGWLRENSEKLQKPLSFTLSLVFWLSDVMKSSFQNALNFWKESCTEVRLVSKLPQRLGQYTSSSYIKPNTKKVLLWQHTIKEAALKYFTAVTLQGTMRIGNVSSLFKFLWEPLSFRDWTMNTPKCTVKTSTYTIFSLTQRCFRGLA